MAVGERVYVDDCWNEQKGEANVKKKNDLLCLHVTVGLTHTHKKILKINT